MEKLYHVSQTPDLKVLEPRVSTHGKAYVYATTNLELALLFGAHHMGDFDGKIGTDDKGKPYFYEAYKGAFDERYKGKKCYIYEVKPDTFEMGQTNFKGEVMSSKPVKIINCTEVKDLYDYLDKLIEDRKITLLDYNNNPEYVSRINESIKDRIKLFHVLEDPSGEAYTFCMSKFPTIMQELENENTIQAE